MERKEKYFIYLVEKLKEKKIRYNILKLNKLLYFAVAKSEKGFEPLIFEAWRNGPVVASERNDMVHNFFTSIDSYVNYYKSKDIGTITEQEKRDIDYVVEILGDFEPYQLTELSHEDVFKKYNEKKRDDTPWKKINKNLDICKETIPIKDVREYYSNTWFETISENKEKIKKILNERD